MLLVCSAGDAMDAEQAEVLQQRLDRSLASLAEQSLSPDQALLLVPPQLNQQWQEWLREWQREIPFLSVVESYATSVAALRVEALS
ncbi:MAG: glycosyltransferase family 2 protein, partial [Halomonadaceae bacterium]